MFEGFFILKTSLRGAGETGAYETKSRDFSHTRGRFSYGVMAAAAAAVSISRSNPEPWK